MEKIILAVPKGRILDELLPILNMVNIIPEDAFFDDRSRQLRFKTNIPAMEIIRVRSFDVATFIAYGAAHLGIAGKDVLLEFNYPDIYNMFSLGIGKCRLSVAESKEIAREDDPSSWSHIEIATKYPNITKNHFAQRGVQAECIKLNGAMELAPTLGLCHRIVDLVSSGKTLNENGLVEVEKIIDITSCLIVNRTALKTESKQLLDWIEVFRKVINSKSII